MRQRYFLLAWVILCLASPAVRGQTLDYSNGFTGASGVTRAGSATVAGSVLRLTGGELPGAGTAYTSARVNITNFHTRFSFQILTSMHGAESVMADGITFTIQNVSPTAWGGGGGGMGVGPDRHSSPLPPGLPNNVTVKFDVFNNEGEGNSSTGLYLRGVPPTIPALDLHPSGIDLTSHHLFEVAMDYNGTLLAVRIVDTLTGASATQSYTVNIPAVVGGTAAFVGFTGTEGSVGARQSILCWEWNRTATRIVRVAPGGNDGNSGASWSTPVRTIQRGLNLAGAGGEVWVAQGTYFEHVSVPAGVALYGGFRGGETQLSDRNWSANMTTIHGSGTGVGATVQPGKAARIDGFTIRNCERAMTTDNASPFVANNTVTNNANSWGPGIAGDNSSPIIANNVITNNVSTGDGGGILVTGAGSSISYPYVTQNLLTGNVATGSAGNGNAGAMAFWRCHDVVIATNTIRNNSAKWVCGGIGINNEGLGGATVVRNVFEGNVSEHYGGGALHLDQLTYACIADNQFLNNRAWEGIGGLGVYNSTKVKLVRNVSESNHGLWVGGADVYGVGDLLAVWNLFHLNESDHGIGGLNVASSNGLLQYNTLWDNVGEVGAGLRVGDCSIPVLNNWLVGNKASWSGGGIEIYNSSSPVANNLFFGNTAIYGAGVSMGWATPRILNNTIAYNSGTVNCGISLYMSVPELANNVVAFNGFVGIGVNNGTLSGVPNIHHNLVYGNGGLEINVDFPLGPGNFYCDPLFVNPALGDFRVQAASPAIDRGDNSVANPGWLSLDWNARILNGFVDIGAYESLTARIPDITPPVTTAVATPGPNGDGWNKSDVAIALTATDDDCCFGVKQIVYTLSGAQNGGATVPGASASVTITAEGVTTLTYHAVDSEGNIETVKTLVLRIDKTAPLVSYTGLRTYDVSETINIAFTATDALSGIASSSGDQVSGVAADTLPLNQDLLASARATDKAGNSSSASGQYRVIVTFKGLCQLVDRWVTQPGVMNSLCQKLRAAEAARARGNVDASNNILDAFIQEVEAQSGKAISADKATTLIRLARALKS